MFMILQMRDYRRNDDSLYYLSGYTF